MTPIEKASKLVSYYLPFCNNNLIDAKYCATIALDEMTEVYISAVVAMGMEKEIAEIMKSPYIEAVKKELANI